LFVPQGTGRYLRQRAAGLSTRAGLEVFEFCESDGRIEKIDLADAGNIESWLVPRREAESALRAARDATERIPGFAARIVDSGNSVDASFAGANQRSAISFSRS